MREAAMEVGVERPSASILAFPFSRSRVNVIGLPLRKSFFLIEHNAVICHQTDGLCKQEAFYMLKNGALMNNGTNWANQCGIWEGGL